QENHPALMEAEQHAGDTALRHVAAYLPQPPAERPAQRHADRPGKFHVLDVFADDLPIGPIKALEPFPHRHAAGRKLVKGGGKSLHVFSRTNVSKMVRNRKGKRAGQSPTGAGSTQIPFTIWGRCAAAYVLTPPARHTCRPCVETSPSRS